MSTSSCCFTDAAGRCKRTSHHHVSPLPPSTTHPPPTIHSLAPPPDRRHRPLQALVGILANGMQKCFAGLNRGAKYGDGSYFAEDAGKMDQYSEPIPARSSVDQSNGEAQSHDALLNALYRFNPFHEGAACSTSTPSTDGLCYCFVTRVPLGCMERTHDGHRSIDPPHSSIFSEVRSPATPLLSTTHSTTHAESRRAALRRPTPSTSLPPPPYTTTTSTLHHSPIPSSPRWAVPPAEPESSSVTTEAEVFTSTCTRCWRTCRHCTPATSTPSTTTLVRRTLDERVQRLSRPQC